MALENIFSSVQFGKFIGIGHTIIWVVAIGVVLIVAAYFFLILMRYNVRVRVLDVVGDSIQELQDKGALVKDKETKKAFEFRLLRGKVKLPPPPADSFIFAKNGKRVAYAAKISATDYIWLKPSAHIAKREAELIPVDQDVLFWHVQMIERDGEKYSRQVPWYQNPAILFWGTMGITLVILILTFKYSGEFRTEAFNAAQSTANAIVNNAKGAVGQVVS